jgi:hypothetical protein
MNVQSLAIATFLLSAAFLAGCTPTAANLSTPQPSPSAAPNPSASSAQLTEGEYCYSVENDNLDGTVRLTVNAKNQVAGQANTVYHNASESYYSSASQSLAGTLQGQKMMLKLITEIEGNVQENDETWNVTANGIETGRIAYAMVDCSAIAN